ncbi:VWA-like domain-containing protein [Caballeronia sp. GAWG2-1]|uniref:vWA domain-containing protein n=1 Tax=Caballeronia sp. GAWG2-1 TaxID=2921744 RepID=UPI0020289DF2|nr:VWA-like domain-containing protein [Caballeronia sp. GAWG2-1]
MDRTDVVLGSSAVHPRIARQRTELVLSQPFFGALALRLSVREDPSTKTFWVDGETLGYNPKYMESLSDLEVRGVVAHEVLHVANGHCWRQGARDPDRWNDACDYAINPIVLSSGMVLPKGALVDPRYTGKSAEEIYGLLTQEAKEKQQQPPLQPQPGPQDQQQPNGGQAPKLGGENSTAPGQSPADQPAKPGSFGEVRPFNGPDKPVKEAEWKVAVTQAAKAAAMRGKLPGDLQAMAGEAVRPVVDWRAVLYRFAQQSSPSDYSFATPNRRYLHLGFYLPALHTPAVGDAVFVRDSSGSVFDETQAQFDAEILAVFHSLKPARLIVMDCDTRVTQVQIFERGDSPEIKPVRGGGGTAFVDPFNRVAEDGMNPAFLVYLTDMVGRFPTVAPHYPVLWASTTPLTRARKAPFGETMEVIC